MRANANTLRDALILLAFQEDIRNASRKTTKSSGSGSTSTIFADLSDEIVQNLIHDINNPHHNITGNNGGEKSRIFKPIISVQTPAPDTSSGNDSIVDEIDNKNNASLLNNEVQEPIRPRPRITQTLTGPLGRLNGINPQNVFYSMLTRESLIAITGTSDRAHEMAAMLKLDIQNGPHSASSVWGSTNSIHQPRSDISRSDLEENTHSDSDNTLRNSRQEEVDGRWVIPRGLQSESHDEEHTRSLSPPSPHPVFMRSGSTLSEDSRRRRNIRVRVRMPSNINPQRPAIRTRNRGALRESFASLNAPKMEVRSPPPLCLAALNGNLRVVEDILYSLGIFPELDGQSCPPLHETGSIKLDKDVSIVSTEEEASESGQETKGEQKEATFQNGVLDNNTNISPTRSTVRSGISDNLRKRKWNSNKESRGGRQVLVEASEALTHMTRKPLRVNEVNNLSDEQRSVLKDVGTAETAERVLQRHRELTEELNSIESSLYEGVAAANGAEAGDGEGTLHPRRERASSRHFLSTLNGEFFNTNENPVITRIQRSRTLQRRLQERERVRTRAPRMPGAAPGARNTLSRTSLIISRGIRIDESARGYTQQVAPPSFGRFTHRRLRRVGEPSSSSSSSSLSRSSSQFSGSAEGGNPHGSAEEMQESEEQVNTDSPSALPRARGHGRASSWNMLTYPSEQVRRSCSSSSSGVELRNEADPSIFRGSRKSPCEHILGTPGSSSDRKCSVCSQLCWVHSPMCEWSALHFAVMGGHCDVVLLLLRAGLSPNLHALTACTIGSFWVSPVGLAVFLMHLDVLRILMDFGGNVQNAWSEHKPSPEPPPSVATYANDFNTSPQSSGPPKNAAKNVKINEGPAGGSPGFFPIFPKTSSTTLEGPPPISLHSDFYEVSKLSQVSQTYPEISSAASTESSDSERVIRLPLSVATNETGHTGQNTRKNVYTSPNTQFIMSNNPTISSEPRVNPQSITRLFIPAPPADTTPLPSQQLNSVHKMPSFVASGAAALNRVIVNNRMVHGSSLPTLREESANSSVPLGFGSMNTVLNPAQPAVPTTSSAPAPIPFPNHGALSSGEAPATVALRTTRALESPWSVVLILLHSRDLLRRPTARSGKAAYGAGEGGGRGRRIGEGQRYSNFEDKPMNELRAILRALDPAASPMSREGDDDSSDSDNTEENEEEIRERPPMDLLYPMRALLAPLSFSVVPPASVDALRPLVLDFVISEAIREGADVTQLLSLPLLKKAVNLRDQRLLSIMLRFLGPCKLGVPSAIRTGSENEASSHHPPRTSPSDRLYTTTLPGFFSNTSAETNSLTELHSSGAEQKKEDETVRVGCGGIGIGGSRLINLRTADSQPTARARARGEGLQLRTALLTAALEECCRFIMLAVWAHLSSSPSTSLVAPVGPNGRNENNVRGIEHDENNQGTPNRGPRPNRALLHTNVHMQNGMLHQVNRELQPPNILFPAPPPPPPPTPVVSPIAAGASTTPMTLDILTNLALDENGSPTIGGISTNNGEFEADTRLRQHVLRRPTVSGPSSSREGRRLVQLLQPDILPLFRAPANNNGGNNVNNQDARNPASGNNTRVLPEGKVSSASFVSAIVRRALRKVHACTSRRILTPHYRFERTPNPEYLALLQHARAKRERLQNQGGAGEKNGNIVDEMKKLGYTFREDPPPPPFIKTTRTELRPAVFTLQPHLNWRNLPPIASEYLNLKGYTAESRNIPSGPGGDECDPASDVNHERVCLESALEELNDPRSGIFSDFSSGREASMVERAQRLATPVDVCITAATQILQWTLLGAALIRAGAHLRYTTVPPPPPPPPPSFAEAKGNSQCSKPTSTFVRVSEPEPRRTEAPVSLFKTIRCFYPLGVSCADGFGCRTLQRRLPPCTSGLQKHRVLQLLPSPAILPCSEDILAYWGMERAWNARGIFFQIWLGGQ